MFAFGAIMCFHSFSVLACVCVLGGVRLHERVIVVSDVEASLKGFVKPPLPPPSPLI